MSTLRQRPRSARAYSLSSLTRSRIIFVDARATLLASLFERPQIVAPMYSADFGGYWVERRKGKGEPKLVKTGSRHGPSQSLLALAGHVSELTCVPSIPRHGGTRQQPYAADAIRQRARLRSQVARSVRSRCPPRGPRSLPPRRRVGLRLNLPLVHPRLPRDSQRFSFFSRELKKFVILPMSQMFLPDYSSSRALGVP